MSNLFPFAANALRRIIDKDQQDILKPKWIRDSVQNQEHAPFTKQSATYSSFFKERTLTRRQSSLLWYNGTTGGSWL